MPETVAQSSHTLVRAMGRWSLAAVILNIVIGASAFGIPSEIAAHLGPLSPFAFLLGGAFALVIGACFAEVSSYFDQAGGPYLYVREAFGGFPAVYVAWIMMVARVAAVSAIANLFVTYLAQFFPLVDAGTPRIAVITGVLSLFGFLNVIGIKVGAGTSNALVVLKVAALVVFAIAGVLFLATHGSPGHASALRPVTLASWLEAGVLTVFSFGGFETGLVPAGEAKDARRDAPIAVLAALGIAVVLYTLVQAVVTYTLPNAALVQRPLAEASKSLLGPWGPAGMSVAALVSILGYLIATTLSAPRILYAIAQNGDMPAVLARLHPRFRTPHVAVILYVTAVWTLTIFGSFRWGVFFSSVTRLVVYAAVCAAVFVFRRRDTQPGMKIAAAPVFALLGIALCVLLGTRMGKPELFVLIGALVPAAFTHFWHRRARA